MSLLNYNDVFLILKSFTLICRLLLISSAIMQRGPHLFNQELRCFSLDSHIFILLFLKIIIPLNPAFLFNTLRLMVHHSDNFDLDKLALLLFSLFGLLF